MRKFNVNVNGKSYVVEVDEVGAETAAPAPVVVLEAMKMENDIVANADGKVTFLVKPGDNVVSGADLASIN